MKMHNISIVIPVYKGQQTLPYLVARIKKSFDSFEYYEGISFRLLEIILVHDCGPDRSDLVIKDLSQEFEYVTPIWLTRNFGQHAATLAGISHASGDWIVTMDEDGLHDPENIFTLISAAYKDDLQVIYAFPNRHTHNFLRRITSSLAKWMGGLFTGNKDGIYFHSFRVIRGDVARSLAAYCASGVYLDIALLWVAGRVGRCPIAVTSAAVEARPSGYSGKKLLDHFIRLFITSGTRPLRLVTIAGFFSIFISFAGAGIILFQK